MKKKKENAIDLLPLGELLDVSWERLHMSVTRLSILLLIQLAVYGICVALFVGLMFTAGLSVVLSQIISLHSVTFAHFNGSIFVVGSIIILFCWILCSIVIHIATIRIIHSKGAVSVTPTFQQSLSLVVPFVLLYSIYAFLLAGGLFFFILPFFLLFFFFSFAPYALVVDGYTPLGALRRSIALVWAYPFALLLRLLLLLGMLVIPCVLFSQVSGENFLLFLFLTGVQIVFGWFSISYMYEMYSDVSSKVLVKEGKLLWVFIVSIIGWILAIFLGVRIYSFIQSGMMERFLRQDMQRENRAEYRIRPGARIEFLPYTEVKES